MTKFEQIVLNILTVVGVLSILAVGWIIYG